MPDRNPALQRAVQKLIRLTIVLYAIVVVTVGTVVLGLYLRTMDNHHFTALVCRSVENLKTLRRDALAGQIARLEIRLRDSPSDAAILADLVAAMNELSSLAADKC